MFAPMFVGKRKYAFLVFLLNIQLQTETTDTSHSQTEKPHKDTYECIQDICTYCRINSDQYALYGSMMEQLKEYLQLKKHNMNEEHVKELTKRLIQQKTTYMNADEAYKKALHAINDKSKKEPSKPKEKENFCLSEESSADISSDTNPFKTDKHKFRFSFEKKKMYKGKDLIEKIEDFVRSIFSDRKDITKLEEKIRQYANALELQNEKNLETNKMTDRANEQQRLESLTASIEVAKTDAEEKIVKIQEELQKDSVGLQNSRDTLIESIIKKSGNVGGFTSVITRTRVDDFINEFHKETQEYEKLADIEHKLKPCTSALTVLTAALKNAKKKRDKTIKKAKEAQTKCEVLFNYFNDKKLRKEERRIIFEMIKEISSKHDVIEKIEKFQSRVWSSEYYSFGKAKDSPKVNPEDQKLLSYAYDTHLLTYFRLALHLSAMYTEYKMYKTETFLAVMNLKLVSLKLRDALFGFEEICDKNMPTELEALADILPQQMAEVCGTLYAILEREKDEISKQEAETYAVLSQVEDLTKCFLSFLESMCGKTDESDADRHADKHDKTGPLIRKLRKDDRIKQETADNKIFSLEEMAIKNEKIIKESQKLIEKRAVRYFNRSKIFYNLGQNLTAESYMLNIETEPKDKTRIDDFTKRAEYAGHIAKEIETQMFHLSKSDNADLYNRFFEKTRVKDLPALLVTISEIYKEKVRRERMIEEFEQFLGRVNHYNKQIRYSRQITSYAHKLIQVLSLRTEVFDSMITEVKLFIKINKMATEIEHSNPRIIVPETKDKQYFSGINEKLHEALALDAAGTTSQYTKSIKRAGEIMYLHIHDFEPLQECINLNTQRLYAQKSASKISAFVDYLLDCNFDLIFTNNVEYDESTQRKIQEFIANNKILFEAAYASIRNKINDLQKDEARQTVKSIAQDRVEQKDKKGNKIDIKLKAEVESIIDAIITSQPEKIKERIKNARNEALNVQRQNLKENQDQLKIERKKLNDLRANDLLNEKRKNAQAKDRGFVSTLLSMLPFLIGACIVFFGAWYIYRKCRR